MSEEEVTALLEQLVEMIDNTLEKMEVPPRREAL